MSHDSEISDTCNKVWGINPALTDNGNFQRPPHLTRAVTRHGKVVWYYRRGKGKRQKLPAPIDPGFAEAYDDAVKAEAMRKAPRGPSAKQLVGAVMRRSVSMAAARAVAKRVPFDLTLDQVLAMAEAQAFRCVLTGIQFYSPHKSSGRMNPYAPSIDRISPKLGYTISNVRIVIFAINTMLFDWGPDVFREVVDAYLRKNPIPSPTGPGEKR